MIVINRNELHYGLSQSDHLFYYALIADFSPQSHSLDAPEMKFITPITQNRLIFENRISGDDALASMLSIIHELEQQEFGYELAVKSELYRSLRRLFEVM